MMIKLGDKPYRKSLERGLRTGPNRRPHRQEIVIVEFAGKTVLRKELFDGYFVITTVDQLLTHAVKLQNPLQQAIKTRSKYVAALREQSWLVRTAIFQIGSVATDAEGHGCRLRWNLQLVQHFDEVRISSIVENDEAGID